MSRKPRVLIVDDEPSARKTLEALLFREGYHLAFAASGQETLARLDELEPDVILLDVMMPGMDGLEVCRLLKADEQWRHIPIVLITALDSRDDVIRGLNAGTDEFLSKPIGGPELRARVRSMLRIKKQFDELQATLQLRKDLSNMIVHDMRSPLTAILGVSELLKLELTAPNNLKDVETISAQAERLNSFLNDVLMLAKTQENRLILNRSEVDVARIVEQAQENHNAIARSRNINLVVEQPPVEPPLVSLDASLFQRVLDNLLSNALKYSPPESTVTLRLAYLQVQDPSSAARVRVQVLDQGPGIPKEHRDRVFEKFEIVALKKQGTAQIGLGLAFCKMVVDAHGGRIFVEDNRPQGTVFTVEI